MLLNVSIPSVVVHVWNVDGKNVCTNGSYGIDRWNSSNLGLSALL